MGKECVKGGKDESGYVGKRFIKRYSMVVLGVSWAGIFRRRMIWKSKLNDRVLLLYVVKGYRVEVILVGVFRIDFYVG